MLEMPDNLLEVDVLCVGHASYDLVYSVPHHPAEDEKMLADGFLSCGGGPAANAAVQVAKLGLKSAFVGYLGNDLYGDKHLQELIDYGVDVDWVVRGASPTPISTVLVKPDGKRALINYKGETKALPVNVVDFSTVNPKVVLFDGHEPRISVDYAKSLFKRKIPMVLDAGSLHEGTQALVQLVDYPVCSEKFAIQWAGNVENALAKLAKLAPYAVITLGERGLIWQRGEERGELPAYKVNAIDTTGAGDAFHGAFAAALALGMPWDELLRYASAAGALCCTKAGARPGLSSYQEHQGLFQPAK
jgi:sulfofructose kinase